jgi:hypothetical protein
MGQRVRNGAAAGGDPRRRITIPPGRGLSMKKMLGVAALAFAAMLGTAACGGGDDAEGGAAGDSVNTTTTTTAAPPAGTMAPADSMGAGTMGTGGMGGMSDSASMGGTTSGTTGGTTGGAGTGTGGGTTPPSTGTP